MRAWITFKGPYRSEAQILKSLPLFLELFPAISLEVTAKGSTYTSLIPSVESCKAKYLKDNRTVTGWLPAGRYVFKAGYYGADLEWYTQLGSYVVKINLCLDSIRWAFVSYREVSPSAKNSKWQATVSKRVNPGCTRITYWSAEQGRNDMTFYHPDSLSPSEMFDFTGLIPE